MASHFWIQFLFSMLIGRLGLPSTARKWVLPPLTPPVTPTHRTNKPNSLLACRKPLRFETLCFSFFYIPIKVLVLKSVHFTLLFLTKYNPTTIKKYANLQTIFCKTMGKFLFVFLIIAEFHLYICAKLHMYNNTTVNI